ncbi:MAG: hypothetical protein AAF467_26440 [Actinomycetota bacterium]
MSAENPATETTGEPALWSAVGDLHHRFLTGLILALVTRQGTPRAAEVVFRTFRHQHLELFRPGLTKLGLDDEPDAVACAKYHVLSNALGGVGVVWIPESDTKSWVRYYPPRWIFDGTAICGVPTEVSRAMLRGWHGHNGVSLDNPNLGFVATMQTTDGQPGLEGYYVEEDHPLDEDERVRFRPGERPPGEPVELPVPTWGPDRLAKVERNYALAYIRSILPAMCAVLGPADAAGTGRTAARQIGMQYHAAVMAPLDASRPFAERMRALLAAHGSAVAVAGAAGSTDTVAIDRWSVVDAGTPAEAFECWNGLWEGMAAMEGLRLTVSDRLDHGDPTTTWRISSA